MIKLTQDFVYDGLLSRRDLRPRNDCLGVFSRRGVFSFRRKDCLGVRSFRRGVMSFRDLEIFIKDAYRLEKVGLVFFFLTLRDS